MLSTYVKLQIRENQENLLRIPYHRCVCAFREYEFLLHSFVNYMCGSRNLLKYEELFAMVFYQGLSANSLTCY